MSILKVKETKIKGQIAIYQCTADMELNSPIVMRLFDDGKLLYRSNINTDVYDMSNNQEYKDLYNKALEMLKDNKN